MGAQASEGKGRVGARGDDQMELRREVVEEKVKVLVDGFGFDKMVVVQHQNNFVGKRG
jgi:hypothetical protein